MNFTIDNPIQFQKLVGLRGLGPLTSRLSGVRSNQLSYRPMDCLRVKPSKPNIVLDRCASTRIEVNPWIPSVPHRKEVIQPLVLERLPCYDFTPIIGPTLDS